MSFNPPSRKNVPKKTYGKNSRARYNMYGRDMWTDEESAESIARIHIEAQAKRERKRKDRIADVVDDVGPRNLETDADVDSVTNHLLSLSLSKSTSAQSTSETTATTAPTTDDPESGADTTLSRRSSTGTLIASSDKENEPSLELLKTPPRDPALRRVSPMHLTPMRGVLGEKSPDEAVESPPRKHGLRKRSSMLSSTGAGPSPLRRQTPSKGQVDATPSTPIPVWDDDLQDVIIQTESPIPRSPQVAPQRDEIEERRVPVPKIEVVIPKRRSKHSSAIGQEMTSCELKTAPQGSSASSSELSELTDLSEQSSSQTEDCPSTEELLNLCTVSRIVDFSAHMNAVESHSVIKKLGEASYSEVYLQTPTDCDEEPVVLKIIPFGKEEQCEISQIIQEIRITKAMGDIEGFIGFRGAYITRGYFPDILMEEWDVYDEEYGSENERPDFYEEDQLFAIIMLEMGGSDLEHTDLYGWEDAFDVFYQTAVALARGEKGRQFEHRDLHFGNIVIRRKPQTLPTRKKDRHSTDDEDPASLLANLSLAVPATASPRVSNLKVAMIDYTLSRAQCGSDPKNPGEFIEFAPLDDPALFTGKGNYQFDIYRFMKSHIMSLAPSAPDGSDDPEKAIDWNMFAPVTNIYWLHYLIDILINKKGIPKPAMRGRFKTSEEEREYYKCLETVGRRINPRKKILGAAKGGSIESAVDLVKWCVEEGLFPEVEI